MSEPLKDQEGRLIRCNYLYPDNNIHRLCHCTKPAVQITKDEFGNIHFSCEDHIEKLSHAAYFTGKEI